MPLRLLLLSCAFALPPLTTACEPAGADCSEPCELDDDCGFGLMCAGSTFDRKCVPQDCAACFESGRSCSYSEEIPESGPIQCSLNFCF